MSLGLGIYGGHMGALGSHWKEYGAYGVPWGSQKFVLGTYGHLRENWQYVDPFSDDLSPSLFALFAVRRVVMLRLYGKMSKLGIWFICLVMKQSLLIW